MSERITSENAIEQRADVERLQGFVDGMVMNTGFEGLAAVSGRVEPLPADPRARLAELQQIAAAHWGTHRAQGQSRQDVDKAPDQPTDAELEARALAAGERLGSMLATEPKGRDRDLDVGVVLGGANHANKHRFAWMMEHSNPQVSVVVASGRKLKDAERQAVAAYAPDATDEYELARASVLSYFAEQAADAGYPEGDHRIARVIAETVLPQPNGDEWRLTQVRYWDAAAGVFKDVFVVGSSEKLHDGRGAEYTPDTYSNLEWVVNGMRLRRGARIGISTTGLFVPEAHVAAVAVLGSRGIAVTTFGHDHTYSGVKRTRQQIELDANVTVERLALLQAELDARST